MAKGPLPPSNLSKVVQQLTTGPRLTLNGLRRISLNLAVRNGHAGARHFVKEQLPRIRWANPLLDIHMINTPKKGEDELPVHPELLVEHENGVSKTIDMSKKWSTAIVKELMDLAGGDPWKSYKSAALTSGHPILPGEEKERLTGAVKGHKNPLPRMEQPLDLEAKVEEMLSAPDRAKTGAAAILP
ncbi:hypothetical protein SCLCIDRAFT_1224696 [Scleroderma citrinum Foug A]|uniref:Ribosomal protein/NADH dehydrogenase domain-containing protein n=1 Tax=Scleroderma citrinum Foug A TaxID=1036808 RepID=A0A0C3D587_9AGAM|nr:hypothetical protein SCLCIDRAFT_1224696 [Scleroderma citrinum Foug A]